MDLVCYAVWDDIGRATQYRLAHKSSGWLPANPPALIEHVRTRRAAFDGTEDATGTDQLRRSVRYLKRWNDEAIQRESSDKPTGLAFTLLCCESLNMRTFLDRKPDDLTALQELARSAADRSGRIVLLKPTPEYEDILARLTEDQMTKLKARFGKLRMPCRRPRRTPIHIRHVKASKLSSVRSFQSPRSRLRQNRGPAPPSSAARAPRKRVA